MRACTVAARLGRDAVHGQRSRQAHRARPETAIERCKGELQVACEDKAGTRLNPKPHDKAGTARHLVHDGHELLLLKPFLSYLV